VFHIQFIRLNKRNKMNPYNKIKTKFIYHWCTQKSLYTNVHSMSEYCVHRTSKPLAFILRVRARTPKVSPEQGKFWLCTSEDVAQWSPCCVPWTLMKIGGKLPGPRDGQCLLCSLCKLTSFLWQMITNILVSDYHSLANMSVLHQMHLIWWTVPEPIQVPVMYRSHSGS
jgi:hypothetical protein